jgi:diacylglycerol kinase
MIVMMSFVANVARSFRYAWHGVRYAGRERNMRIMLAAAAAAILLAALCDLSSTHWAIVSLCIGGVLGAEAMNSAIERLADQIERKYDADIRDIKDAAAGAVLLVSLGAAVTGIIIFWAYLR